MRELFQPHLNSEIGINISKPLHIESVLLTGIQADYFTVTSRQDGNVYHVPFINVVKIIENPNGVAVGGLFTVHKTCSFVVKIGHVVDYLPA